MLITGMLQVNRIKIGRSVAHKNFKQDKVKYLTIKYAQCEYIPCNRIANAFVDKKGIAKLKFGAKISLKLKNNAENFQNHWLCFWQNCNFSTLKKQCSAHWLSGRLLDLRLGAAGSNPYRRHCVVSLSKSHLSLLNTGSTQEDQSQHNC